MFFNSGKKNTTKKVFFLANIYFSYSSGVATPKVPTQLWSKENQIIFWQNYAKNNAISSVEDWNKIKVTDIKKNGGSGILARHKSLLAALTYAFPETNFHVLEVGQKLPNRFWDKRENQILFFEQIQKKHNLSKIEDLSTLKSEDIKKQKGGKCVLQRYSSYQNCLTNLFPSINWAVLFENKVHLPRNYWNDINNQKKELEKIAKLENLSSLNDLLNVKISGYPSLRYIASKYNSFSDALQAIYPENDWKSLIDSRQSKIKPKNYWQNKQTQRKFMEDLRKKLNISSIPDWIDQPVRVITTNGGSGLLAIYPTFTQLLQSVYPEFDWSKSDIKNFPRNYWNNIDNVRNFMEHTKRKLHIVDDSDWQRISVQQILKLGGGGLLRHYCSLMNILQTAYPGGSWDRIKFANRNKRATQRWLLVCLQELFPFLEIVEDFLHEKLTRLSGSKTEIDIFIPSKNIGFEYHGEHHYMDLPSFGSLELYKTRDEEKVRLCEENRITLIIIPYWWDNSIQHLKEIISDQTNISIFNDNKP